MSRQDVGDKKDGKRSVAAKGKLELYLTNGKTKEVADWMSVDAEIIQRAIAAAGYKGGALRFGYTSDGGAYSIGVYDGDQKYTSYVRPGEVVEDTLRRIIDYFGEG